LPVLKKSGMTPQIANQEAVDRRTWSQKTQPDEVLSGNSRPIPITCSIGPMTLLAQQRPAIDSN
jgi:hypothetical protein